MREMKDSGVEWIGKIPKDWEIVPLTKQLDSIVDYRGKTPEKTEEGTFLVTAKNIKDGKICYELSKEYVREADYEEIMHRGIPQIGDILFTTEAPLGQVANVDRTDIALAQRIIKFRALSTVNNYYLKYWMLNEGFQQFLHSLSTGSTATGIKSSKLFLLPLVRPNIEQQNKIVEYLDAKCSKIDEIVEKQKVIIEKLEEYKLSIITEAVTKGLNPDVEMKDSGNIEIGKIPSISRPTKLKYLCNTQGRIGFKGYTTTDLVDEGEGAYTLGASHLNNGKIDLTDPVFISWEKYYESPEIMVKQNDILIVQRGSTIGKVAIVDKNYGEVTINPSLVLINKIHIDSKYLLYALSARYIINYINLIGTTTAIPMISQKQINDLVVIVPPDSIQISVVKYLDEKCGKIDANILKKQKLIDKLQEYKKSLIYEVVTGKKEV